MSNEKKRLPEGSLPTKTIITREKKTCKRIRYFQPEDVEEIVNAHFSIYNPDHEKKNVWHYEYDGIEDALKDFSYQEILDAIHKQYVLIMKEI